MAAGRKERARLEWDVIFRCTEGDRPAFTSRVPIEAEPKEKLVAVSSQEQTPEDAAARELPDPSPPSWEDAEFTEWIKNSSSTARDFCRTMITTCSAAIPVYFAVLKYLGFETVGGGWLAASILPPVLLLAAGLAFVLGLRPTFSPVPRAEFATYRDMVLQRINRHIGIGLSLFALAISLAMGLFFLLLEA